MNLFLRSRYILLFCQNFVENAFSHFFPSPTYTILTLCGRMLLIVKNHRSCLIGFGFFCHSRSKVSSRDIKFNGPQLNH